MRVLVCPDKFKGTASGAEVADAVARACAERGWQARTLPLADGGDGTLDALGGANRTTTVTGPLGDPVSAGWRLDEDGTAVLEAARCCGLTLAGGGAGNDPVAATSAGVGELLAHVLAAGARRVLVTVGGVATTDGGRPVVELLGRFPEDVPVRVACDVRTRFVDAARVFGPQKGAGPAQVEELTARLHGLLDDYRRRGPLRPTGEGTAPAGLPDLADLPGGGAAGGLGGALAVLGARLVPGFDLVADALDLDDAIRWANLVVTGEGRLDRESFDGKVVGGVLERSRRAGRRCVAVVGSVRTDDLGPDGSTVEHLALDAVVGHERALHDTVAAVQDVAGLLLDRVAPGRTRPAP